MQLRATRAKKQTEKCNNYQNERAFLLDTIQCIIFTSPDILVRTVLGLSWNIFGLELFRSWDHLNLKTQRHPLTEFRIGVVVTEWEGGGDLATQGVEFRALWLQSSSGCHHSAARVRAHILSDVSRAANYHGISQVIDQEDASQQRPHSGIFRSRKWAGLILICLRLSAESHWLDWLCL